ncbi:ABC transporter ATP-binding protein [Nocardioides sp. GY 10113]|uniref:ABC transporter ATP-binding protein n=1 Tax=Nocardioides sp. GY 10113 TaxID=2569761 RepID=UPI0010A90A0A|nr:ABC transporter ATP-binding protein [Nocardioides sp. GY 10113]TIC87800.1 ABC transporter ATP-binding protein [Nocardioides sp. GY 10113]
MQSSGDAVIEIRDLVKTFGPVRALDGLDLEVRRGEVHGFLGPNGAGKSTTLRVLLGLLRRDSGDVRLFGGDPWREAAELHRRLAYVPGDVSLWPNLTGGEAIDLLGRLRGGLDPKRRDELIEMFELDPTKRGRSYSKGNRQKVALVAALAADTELLLLDEPTSGLDPLKEETFTGLVDRFRDDGGSVLLSSHILAEVEKLGDRVSIIRSGRIVESGSLADLRHLTRTSLDVELVGPPTGIAGLPAVHDVQVDGHRLRCQVETDQLNEVLGALHRVGVRTLISQPPTLEELFLRHYGDEPEEPVTPGEATAASGAST